MRDIDQVVIPSRPQNGARLFKYSQWIGPLESRSKSNRIGLGQWKSLIKFNKKLFDKWENCVQRLIDIINYLYIILKVYNRYIILTIFITLYLLGKHYK